MTDWTGATALVVVDVQQGLDDAEYYGHRNNPSCEIHIGQLIAAWRQQNWPIVFVKHNSVIEGSPLRPDDPGNALKSVVSGDHDVLVTKSVASAFYGEPDLHAWLQSHGITGLAVCGIQTNVCCETTARQGSDLGYDVLFVTDATATFPQQALDGRVISAEELTRTTESTLAHEFCRIVRTADLVG